MVQPLGHSCISHTLIPARAIWDSQTIFALDIIMKEKICKTLRREKP